MLYRAISSFEEQKEFLVHYKNQCKLWKKETKDPKKLLEVSSLQKKIKQVKELNTKLLNKLDLLKNKTIDSILNKTDEEVGIEFLLGMFD